MADLKARFKDYLAINPFGLLWEGIRQIGVQLWIVIKGLAQITRLLIVLTFNLAGFLLWLAGFVIFAVVIGFGVAWTLWIWLLLAIVLWPFLYIPYGLFQMWLERQGP